MHRPLVYEINAWVWLHEVCARAGVPAHLARVPPREWDAIAALAPDAVWLMGVWTRSPAGVAIALRNPGLVRSFRDALPDYTEADVVGSPYCVRDYAVDPALGGPEGLATARAELAARGVALILDFVPNHVAPDHPWTLTHPERFITGTEEDLERDPGGFVRVGDHVLALGRDPNYPAWPDVVQLDAFSPDLRAAVVATLRDIAGQCDGVRCDMAMLPMTAVFSRTWGSRAGDPPAQEYWPEVIGAVRETHPALEFMAEAYWDLEWDLQRQGFDHCYDKRLYDRLVEGDAEEVRRHLVAGVDYQDRLVRFVENHDEPRAAAAFPPERLRAATVAALTQTGARMVHEGQIEGRRVHLPVFLGRRPEEPADEDLVDFHRRLLGALADPGLRRGEWSLLSVGTWPGDDSGRHLVAWCLDGTSRWLVVVNLGAAEGRGTVRLPWKDLRDRRWVLRDPTTGEEFAREGADLVEGLYVARDPGAWHVLRIDEEARE